MTSTQFKVQSLAYNYSKRLALKGIYNSSVIVIDNKTRSVVAYIGSNDKNDVMHNGMVDGVNAIRSPGSTLKPLVYALAIDKGLLAPLFPALVMCRLITQAICLRTLIQSLMGTLLWSLHYHIHSISLLLKY